MKALILDHGLKHVTDHRLPVPTDGEALIRVLWAGVCRTDHELLRGYMEFRGIPGHEFVGVVEQCQDRIWTGKRVVGEINCPCRLCATCRRGQQRHCPERTVLGMQGRDGVFAEYVTLPVDNLHEVPDSISDEEAVFVEPLAAAFRIEEQVDIAAGNRVIVVGDGKLGLFVAQVLHMKKRQVTLVGKHRFKLKLVEPRGIETVLVGENPGQQADTVVDCSGTPAGFMSALSFLRPGGKLIVKSTFTESLHLDMAALVVNEMTIIGSRCGPFPPAIQALAWGAIEVRSLITHRFSLEDGPQVLAAHDSSAIGILFRIGAS